MWYVLATDGNQYTIRIPFPIVRDSKEEAMKDGNDGKLGCRFVLLDGDTEPIIIIYGQEEWMPTEDGRGFYSWVSGNVVGIYTYAKFVEAHGIMYLCKDDYVETDKTFADIFPNMEKYKLYYIDNEAYSIEEV